MEKLMMKVKGSHKWLKGMSAGTLPLLCSAGLIRRGRKSRVVVAAAVGLVLGWGGLAGIVHAALITFDFEGNVTSVAPSVSSYFSTSDKLVGSYTFDSSASDQQPSSQYGAYAIDQLSFTLGQDVYSAGSGYGTPFISITSNSALYSNPSPDSYKVSSFINIGPSAGALLPRDFSIVISGLRKFPNDSLPLTPPSLTDVPSAQRAFTMSFIQPVGAVGVVSGEITSLTLGTPAPVPLPGAVVLFGSGLIGLVAFGRRQVTRQS